METSSFGAYLCVLLVTFAGFNFVSVALPPQLETIDDIKNVSFPYDHGPISRRGIKDEKTEYKATCGRLFRMVKGRAIIINSYTAGRGKYLTGEDTCEWNFLGTADCAPEIACETVDLRCSKSEYLLIMDGMHGGTKLCDSSHQGHTWKSSSGRDMFVALHTASSTSFERHYKGFRCRVKCAADSTPKLPAASGLFKEDPCECGLYGASKNRIVGGTAAKPFEFPWIVSLVSPGTRSVTCGASLINSDYVLTAAHCFGNPKPKYEVLIHAHDLDKSDNKESTERRQISKVMCHRWYKGDGNFDYDVCILKLSSPVNIQKHTPVCLPAPQPPIHDDESVHAIVAGWGYLKDGGSAARVLQKVTVPLISLKRCRSEFSYPVTDRMICAGYAQGGKDACQGDSGGPLIVKEKLSGGGHRGILIGIVSWGIGCAGAGNPGAYSRVAEFVPWIRKLARSGTWCKNH